MISKIPIVGSPVGFYDISAALWRMNSKAVFSDFKSAISGFVPAKYIYFTGSGIASFYVILSALKEKSAKKEVIIPAYTAGSLVVAIIKAGLKPVLCDISLDDFNLERESLFKVISSDTLAVVCVHMFGIGIRDIKQLKDRIPSDIFLIEDCAQSMGAKIAGNQAGIFGDISFFSFNRGKNLPTYKGGCITTVLKELADDIEKIIGNSMEKQNAFFEFLLPLKILAILFATKPFFYGLSYPVISLFKDIAPPKDIKVEEFSRFQASLGLSLLNKREVLFEKRYQNGMFLISGLKSFEGIKAALIPNDLQPAFNRFPLVFRDLIKKERVEKKFKEAGIETSRMYLKPLHHMFDLGYKKEEFPNACYFAEHLLTLPVHPLVREEDLQKMINIIRETVK